MQADVFYPITCGDAKATLIWKKFVCPGINVKCVQVYAAVSRNTHVLGKRKSLYVHMQYIWKLFVRQYYFVTIKD